jgi:hypothetical protein
MPRTTRQMFDHAIEPVKGWYGDTSLTCHAKLSANVTIDPVYKGRVAHLNSSGEWEMGASGHEMPVFLFQNSDDSDVQERQDPGNGIYRATGSGIMSGWVCSGGFEVETTEFDDDQTYAVNDLIRAQKSNSASATGGVLTNAGITLYTNLVCGVVSKTPFTNPDNKRMIRLWTVFLPGTD